MKNELSLSHARYFIYRHRVENGELVIEYREATGTWVRDFSRANLWADKKFVITKAKGYHDYQNGPLLMQAGKPEADIWKFCVGKVTIAPYPQFIPILIGGLINGCHYST